MITMGLRDEGSQNMMENGEKYKRDNNIKTGDEKTVSTFNKKSHKRLLRPDSASCPD